MLLFSYITRHVLFQVDHCRSELRYLINYLHACMHADTTHRTEYMEWKGWKEWNEGLAWLKISKKNA